MSSPPPEASFFPSRQLTSACGTPPPDHDGRPYVWLDFMAHGMPEVHLGLGGSLGSIERQGLRLAEGMPIVVFDTTRTSGCSLMLGFFSSILNAVIGLHVLTGRPSGVSPESWCLRPRSYVERSDMSLGDQARSRMVRWIISACTAGTGVVELMVFFWIDARNATPEGSVEANTRAITAGLTFFVLPLCLVAGYLLAGIGGWMRRNRVSPS
jgi:hypothetical protein